MYLGINAFYHDAGAAIIDENGCIIAAVQEERFTRKKRESCFPVQSIAYCLKEAGISINELKGIGFSWDPSLIFWQRILWLNLIKVPASFSAIRENFSKVTKIRNTRKLLKVHFDFDSSRVPFSYVRHHACHAANAYLASPFESAAFLTIDGQGEMESMTWGLAARGNMKRMGRNNFPHSIGKVYSGTSRFLGFFGAEKDGTVMALAAFGLPAYKKQFEQILQISKNKKSLKIKVNARYFDFHSTSDLALPSSKYEEIFDVKERRQEESILQVHKDIAASLQARTEEIIIELLKRLHELTHQDNLVLSGGVALNSVLNGKLEAITPFKKVFIQPAASDAGLPLGAAYFIAQKHMRDKKLPTFMETALLGPSFTETEYEAALKKHDLKYHKSESVADETACLIAEGKIIAWFQGRMEFGPRALGARSLLGDARKTDMIAQLNKVKKREQFRPFAISILEEKASMVLDHVADSPFMLMVDTVRKEWRDKIPSAQHVDGSVRIQTVKKGDGVYYDLIKRFYELTETPLIINTSLNIKGDPIVCTPDEAIDTFTHSEIDVLVLGSYIVRK